jgi:hypothetical protein
MSIYHVKTNSSFIESMFTIKSKVVKPKLSSAELYIKANDINEALIKAKKYLASNNGKHLKIAHVNWVQGEIVT